jgi:hypothetical protein
VRKTCDDNVYLRPERPISKHSTTLWGEIQATNTHSTFKRTFGTLFFCCQALRAGIGAHIAASFAAAQLLAAPLYLAPGMALAEINPDSENLGPNEVSKKTLGNLPFANKYDQSTPGAPAQGPPRCCLQSRLFIFAMCAKYHEGACLNQ